MLGGHSIVVTADLDIGRSGRFLSRFNSADDPAVAVFWTSADGARLCLAIDQYDCAADNLRAVGKSLEAVRGLARWGGSNIVGWFEGCMSQDDADARYRLLAKQHHPDAGGDAATMAAINGEYEGLSYA